MKNIRNKQMEEALVFAEIDRDRAALHHVLRAMEKSFPGWIANFLVRLECEKTESEKPTDKLIYHSAIVGIETAMQLMVEAVDGDRGET